MVRTTCPFTTSAARAITITVADTANAIVKWWLPHTGYEDSPRHIEAVLEDMVNKHWLRREVLPDGEILYLRGDACGI